MLVSAGVHVNTKEIFQNDQTSSHMLAMRNYAEALEFHVEKEANIDSRVTLDGITPLHKEAQVRFGPPQEPGEDESEGRGRETREEVPRSHRDPPDDGKKLIQPF